jgi:predicted SAM-dependent methyltransferase
VPLLHIAHTATVSQRALIKRLDLIPDSARKIEHYDQYEYSNTHGTWLLKSHARQIGVAGGHTIGAPAVEPLHVHYGCGHNLIEGWLNIDLHESSARSYRCVNLLEKHPFAENTVGFGFSEDFLEHLSQAESIFFLSEVYRTLAPKGVVRLSFPGLEGVLAKHYSPVTEERVRQGEFEAYTFWGHVHFYSKEELILIARHIGFSRIDVVEFGISRYTELCKLDTRLGQIGLNTYVELTK